MLRRLASVVLAAAFTAVPALASAALSGNGQTVFKDVPVPPGAYPDYARAAFALKGGPHTHPQAFNFGVRASATDVVRWYLQRLPRNGWRVNQVRQTGRKNAARAIVADRTGEAVTVIVIPLGDGTTRVNTIKLVSDV